MSSTHEPVQLLEPSDLLVPLDLSDHQADLFYRCGRAEPAATSQRGFTRASGGTSAPRPIESGRRSPLKSILMVAGALACFGAGTALPQFQSFMRGDLGPGPTVGVGQPAGRVADVATKSDVAAKSDEVKPADPNPAVPTSNEPKTDTALDATGTPPPAANSTDRSGSAVDWAAQPAPVLPAPVVNDAVAGCAGPCNQQPCPKGDANCLEGGAPSPAKDRTEADGSPANPTRAAQPVRQATRAAQPVRQATEEAQPVRQGTGEAQPVRQAASPQDSERVDARASTGQDERPQSSRRSKATAQRERADQSSVGRRNVATVGRSSPAQDVNRASDWRHDFASDDVIANSSDRWQNRDGWRERVVDDAPATRFSGRRENLGRAANWRQDRPSEDRWEERDADRASNWRRDRPSADRWEERDVDRTSSWRRDRYEEYSRDDRRVRAARQDDFVMGRAERNDGPLMMLPPARYRW